MAESWAGTECHSGRVRVVVGDITRAPVHAIVNAANSSLMGGGGVDGAIHRAGGPAILDACKLIRKTDYPDGLPPGSAVITAGGRLAAQVIHTVGPIWRGGHSDEPRLLASCYRECLKLARSHELDTIAFPAISTGVYGYPKTDAAKVVDATVAEYCRDNPHPELIYLVFLHDVDARVYLEAAECR